MKNTGYSIAFMPTSWHVGRKDIRSKTLWAFGPLRFCIHRNLGRWGDL